MKNVLHYQNVGQSNMQHISHQIMVLKIKINVALYRFSGFHRCQIMQVQLYYPANLMSTLLYLLYIEFTTPVDGN